MGGIKHGSGLHHMAYLVDNIQAASEELRKRGMTLENVIQLIKSTEGL